MNALSDHLHEEAPVVLRLGALSSCLNEESFIELCELNPEFRFERTGEGDLVIIAPTGTITGQRGFWLAAMFGRWCEQDGSGVAFDSSTMFELPNGAWRSPDLAWVRRERYEALSPEQQAGFAPICPDFVVELRSHTDRLGPLRAKMREYIANGAQLGWLIDPEEKRVHIYRPDAEVMILDDPRTVSGDPVLPGFVLELSRLWQ